MLHRAVLCTRVKLCDPDQGGGEHQAHSASAKELHLAAAGGNGVVGHDPHRHKIKRDERQNTRNGQALVQGWHDIGHARRSLHKEAPNDGRHNGHSAQGQGVHHGIARRASNQQGAQNHGGNEGDGIGFKKIGCHAGAIAHVIAHVVGNHSRVARIILGNTRFHLAHQVGADVSTFGKDATAQPSKNGNQ